jgi:hypothetical protein
MPDSAISLTSVDEGQFLYAMLASLSALATGWVTPAVGMAVPEGVGARRFDLVCTAALAVAKMSARVRRPRRFDEGPANIFSNQ